MSETAPNPSTPAIHSQDFWDRDRAGINADLMRIEYEASRMTIEQYFNARLDLHQRIIIHYGMMLEAAYKELASLTPQAKRPRGRPRGRKSRVPEAVEGAENTPQAGDE
jgi:hypothetical protein